MTSSEKTAYITEKLSDICDYLRMSVGDDDTAITSCALASLEYIESGVGTYDTTSATAFMLLCALTQDFYDNRTLTQSEQQQKMRQSQTYQSIILQLKMSYLLSQDEDSDEETT